MTAVDSGARRRDARAARRALLLDSARDAFAAGGYHATGVDEIAERAGVSKPVVYRFFGGKLELYRAVLDADADELVTLVRAALAHPDGNRARVEAAIDAYFGFVLADGRRHRLLFDPDLRTDPDTAATVDAAIAHCVDCITDAVTLDAGLDRDRARLLAVGLLGLSRLSAQHWCGSAAGLSQHDAATLMAGLAWRGLSGFPHDPS